MESGTTHVSGWYKPAPNVIFNPPLTRMALTS